MFEFPRCWFPLIWFGFSAWFGVFALVFDLVWYFVVFVFFVFRFRFFVGVSLVVLICVVTSFVVFELLRFAVWLFWLAWSVSMDLLLRVGLPACWVLDWCNVGFLL